MSKADISRTTTRQNESDFEAVFAQHYEAIYAVLFRLTGDRYEADDLTAETFWRLWQNPPARNENLPGWLYRVATRLGYNALRAGQRREHYETAGEQDARLYQPADDPAQAAERHLERERVRKVLRQMPLREVQVLILRHSGLAYKEIAAVVDIAAGSVGTLIARAEKRFEALYGQGGKDASE